MTRDLYSETEDTEKVKSFNSVGIDIGSTTTQLVFSRLTFGFVEEKHKHDIVRRDIIYLSDISFTPFQEDYAIDVERLSQILESAYAKAGFTPTDVDTGAVIITGVASLRHNAKKIVNLFSDQMGKFVCATAGPNFEAILAAYGSGAVEWSKKFRKTVMNVDIGGGTTKIAIVNKGEIIDTAALYVGARHIVMGGDGSVLRIEEPANIIAEMKDIHLCLGERLSEIKQQRLSFLFVKSLFEVLLRSRLSKLTEKLMITPPLSYTGEIDMFVFSGGVSEYIYGYTSVNFGDLGKMLGEEIRENIKRFQISVFESTERIRATVIGESQYTLQVSGNTTLISKPDLLPMRNLSVVAPLFDSKLLSKEEMEAEIKKAISLRDIVEGEEVFALAFKRSVINKPSYKIMKNLSDAVISSLKNSVNIGYPVVLVFEADIGLGIGRVILEEVAPKCNLVSIDEIKLNDFNFIDIGEPVGERGFIPVIIKSLVFPSSNFNVRKAIH